jgi:hypothetical protein
LGENEGCETWKMLITADMDFTFTNATISKFKYKQISIYRFKLQIALVTLSFMSYTMLSLSKSFDGYKTIGEVFRKFKMNY